MRALPALLIAITLAGCHRAAPERRGLDALDEQLIGNGGDRADPATAVALHDQIVVDPTRTRAATPLPSPSATPVRHAAAPAPTERQPRGSIAGCARSLAYAPGWAGRLPAGIAIYPGATIGEAAGTDADGCAMRIVSFAVPAPLAEVAAWYRAHAPGFVVGDRAAGANHMLTGDASDRAFILYLEPRRGGGTDADLIADGGR